MNENEKKLNEHYFIFLPPSVLLVDLLQVHVCCFLQEDYFAKSVNARKRSYVQS